MSKLLKEYKYIEDKIKDIVEILEKNKTTRYKGLYKGIATLLSPIVKNPDILFLGINSGDGAFKEINQGKDSYDTPLRMIGEDETFINGEIDWFKKNTSRGGFVNGRWEAYEWFQRDKPINNIFPARMIDLLYLIAEKKYPKITNNTEPIWASECKKKIMYSNIYPIITSDTRDLYKIFSLLKEENDLKHLWENKKSLKKWDIQLFFVKLSHELVSLIKPKVIVCMGTQAFNDYTYTHNKKKSKIFTYKNDNEPLVIGFSRSGNFSSLLPKLADMIFKEINKD